MTASPHRCRGCGREGRISQADPAKDDLRPVLTIASNWHPDGKPALVCDACRAAAEGARRTGRPA